jgi:DNA-binding transcriptional LysR family regulator
MIVSFEDGALRFLVRALRDVGELEAHLGARPLERSTHRMVLTDAGVAYVDTVKRILSEIEEAETAAAAECLTASGDLAGTTPITFGRRRVLPIVADFLVAHTEMDVRMLGKLPCVGVGLQSPTTSWAYPSPDGGSPQKVLVDPRLSVTTAEVAMSAAIRSVGFNRVLHYQAAKAPRAGRLEIVLHDFEIERVPVHLVATGRDRLSLKTRMFLEFAPAALKMALKEWRNWPTRLDGVHGAFPCSST